MNQSSRWTRAVIGVLVGTLAAAGAPAMPWASEAQASESEPESVVEKFGLPPLPPRAEPEGFVQGKSAVDPESVTPVRRDFVNADGTTTSELSAGPARYRNAAGAWSEIDTSLVRVADGSFSPKSVERPLRLSANSLGPMVVLQTAAGPVSYGHPNAVAVLGQVDETAQTVTYLGALGAGRDIRIQATASGFKEEVVLAEPGVASYVVHLTLPAGHTARDGSKGGVDVLTDQGEVTGHLSDGFAFDAAGEKAPVATRLWGLVAGVAEIRVEVDSSWIADASRAYPVTIDPTYQATTSDPYSCPTSFSPYNACDTVAESESPTTSHHTATNLYAGYTGYTVNGRNEKGRTFLQFPLDSMTSQGYGVISASLQLYTSYAESTGQTYRVHRLTSPISSATTWNNQPTWAATATSSGTITAGYSTRDVTSAVTSWFNGSTPYGLAVVADYESDPLTRRRIRAAEGGTGTVLSITYNRRPSVPVRCCPSSGATVSATPTLTTNPSTDADGDPLSYLIQVLSSDGQTTVVQGPWSGSTTWAVPSGYLSPGTSYRWRVFATDGWATVMTDTSWSFAIQATAPPSTTTTTAAPTTTTTAPAGPNAPTNVDAFGDDAAAEVFWDPPSGGASSYEVRLTDASTGALVKNPRVTGTEAFIEGLRNGREYGVSVVALDASGRASTPASGGTVVAERWDESLYGEYEYWDYEGDPVNVANGNFTMPFTDLDFPRVFGLDATRQYNALDAAGGPFGPGWSSSLTTRLKFLPCSDGARGCGKVAYVGADGRTVHFRPRAGGGYNRPPEFRGDLTYSPQLGYRIEHFDGPTETFDPASGAVLERRNWDGQVVTFVHDAELLASAPPGSAVAPNAVRSTTGYELSLTRNGAGRITKVASSDGREVAYSYDSGGALVAVTDASGGTGILAWTGGRLAEIKDAAGHFVVQNSFDSTGRVVDQTTAGGRLDFAYEAGKTVVSRPSTGAATAHVLDGSLRTTALTDDIGQTWQKTWDARGNLLTETDPGGQVTSYTYDAHDNVTRTLEPGNAERLTVFDSLDRVIREVDPLGVITTYAYEANEREPQQIATPLGTRTRAIVAGLELTNTDADGVTTKFTYDAKRNLATQTDEGGVSITMTYDPAGNLIRQPSGAGPVVEREFDRLRRVLWETDGADGRLVNSYSPAGRIIERAEGPVVGAPSRRTTYTYDAWGRVLSETSAVGETVTSTYDTDGQVVAVSAPGGAVQRTAYDRLGRVLSETAPTGSVTTYAYDHRGEVVKTTVSGGGISSSSSVTTDARGNLLSSTDPLGRVTKSIYDLANRLISRTDPSGGVTTYQYDAAGRETARTDPRGHLWRQSFTAAGRPATSTDPTGAVTRSGYNDLGQLVSLTRPASGTTTYAYDASGRLIRETSPMGNATTHAYDGAGREIETLDPQFGKTTRTFAPTGETLTEADATGGLRRFEYGPAGRMSSAIDPLGGRTTFAYDGRGNLLTRTNAAGNPTTFVYDLGDRLLERSEPGGIKLSYEYDALGRLIASTDTAGKRTVITLDAAGQPTRYAYADGTATDLTYDLSGRVLRASGSGVGTTTRTYDPIGNLTSETNSTTGKTLRFGWDAAGRRSELTYSDGTKATFAYDGDGRLSSLAYPGTPTTTWKYDGDGQPTLEAFGTGDYRTWGWSAGRLTWYGEVFRTRKPDGTYVEEARQTASLSRDAAGRITAERRARGAAGISPPQEVLAYAYDPAGQLRSWSKDGAATSYTYDVMGNRLRESKGDQVRTSTFDTANRLRRTDEHVGGQLVTREDFHYTADRLYRRALVEGGQVKKDSYYWYDARGRLSTLSDRTASNELWKTWRYYDHEGRLNRVLSSSPIASKHVDPEPISTPGVETEATGDVDPPDVPAIDASTPGVSTGWRDTRVTWDPTTPGVPQIASWTANHEQTNFLHGLERVAAVKAGAASFLSRDVHGSVLATATTEEWAMGTDYDPWGAPAVSADAQIRRDAVEGGVGASSHLPLLGYRGELHMDGLIHLRARDYTPTTGRFTTRDPVDGSPGRSAAWNAYPYALNSPVVEVDPTGLKVTQRPLRCAPGRAYHPYRTGEYMRGLTHHFPLPCDFKLLMGYTPVVVSGSKAWPTLVVKPRAAGGGCSVPAALDPIVLNKAKDAFTNACKSHDFGYDLIRFANRTGQQWRGADRLTVDHWFGQFMQRVCRNTGWLGIFNKVTCYASHDQFMAGIQANTWAQGQGCPRIGGQPCWGFRPNDNGPPQR